MTHWYDLETGSPCHTIVGKNGKERPRTIKDARIHKNVPSVTGIIGRLDKPFLHHWRNNQILDAVLTMESTLRPLLKLTEPDKWKAIILEEADKTRKTAEVEGTKLHKALETYYLTGLYNEDTHNWIKPVVDIIQSQIGNLNFLPEKTFASPLGYGGSIDLISIDNAVIIDFKGKSDKFFDSPKFPDEHMMQLAAYRNGYLGHKYNVPCYNLYISYETPGKICLHQWTDKEIEKGWEMFKLLLEFWKLENNFYV